MMKKKSSVLKLLDQASYGSCRSFYINKLKILRSIIESPTSNFEHVWTKSSSTPIVYDDGNLFFNHHKLCMTLNGLFSLPTPLYSIDFKGSFVDTLIYTGPSKNHVGPKNMYKPFLMGLTKNNWLKIYDNKTGKILYEYFLGTKHKFLHISWETSGETILLQSKVNYQDDILLAFAIFEIFPLKFKGSFELSKDKFGNDTKSANISEGLVITGIGCGKNKSVCLYSLNVILEDKNYICKCQLNDNCVHVPVNQINPISNRFEVGVDGIPVNVIVPEKLEPLIKQKCGNPELFFGGFPWHYFFTPPSQSNSFEIYNLSTSKLIENGRVDCPTDSIDGSSLVFHDDHSGRLINTTSNEFTVYKIEREKQGTKLVKQFSVNAQQKKKNDTIYSYSEILGRKRNSKRKKTPDVYEEMTRTIFADDFENELEIISILASCEQDTDENPNLKNGFIFLVDNNFGKIFKKIYLDLNLDEESEYKLYSDMDYQIIIEKKHKKSSSEHFVYIYKLICDIS